MTPTDKIYGRVVQVRKVSRKLAFLVLSMNGSFVDCLYTKDHSVHVGDYLIASGTMQPKPNYALKEEGVKEEEFAIKEIEVLKRPLASSELMMDAVVPERVEALRVRTLINSAINEFYLGRGFTPVQSPAIVGNWAESRTGAFPVKFYDESAYLTISRMIHHQIIQSLGYGNIYEVGQLFRTSDKTSRKKLAEFTNIIIGVTNGTAEDLIRNFTQMIEHFHTCIKNADIKYLKFPDRIVFNHITYAELLERAGVTSITGHQLPKQVRCYLDAQFESFVWVTGFPEHTRPFFVKSVNGTCDDCQLWFKGRNFLAAGGVRETDYDVICSKINKEGKELSRYDFYLNAVRMGLPPVANLDLGIERFLANFFEDCNPADFTFFPRYEGRLVP